MKPFNAIDPDVQDRLARLAVGIRLQFEQATAFLRTPEMQEALKRGWKPLRDSASRLAAFGWTIPVWSTPTEVNSILRAGTQRKIDSLFTSLYHENRMKAFEEVQKDLQESADLKSWRELLRETAEAYRSGLFRVTVPSYLTILEGYLAAHSKRAKDVRRMGHDLKREIRESSGDRIVFVFAVSISSFLERLFQHSDFSGPQPSALNRHWILHGRAGDEWGAADSLRLLQALHTLEATLSLD